MSPVGSISSDEKCSRNTVEVEGVYPTGPDSAVWIFLRVSPLPQPRLCKLFFGKHLAGVELAGEDV